jgi:enoyl-CoA hydratase
VGSTPVGGAAGGLDAAVEDVIKMLLECGPEALRSQKGLFRQWEELPVYECPAFSIESVGPVRIVE